ncbi:MAG TPA: DUF72 domain-containing protein [Thermoanaerobaculia bacterium]|jgi:uncharacterized protein YecE (DUF72 family)|nr:DUF72 domain-containing protein [Thermoanaerobaculia bacterium]
MTGCKSWIGTAGWSLPRAEQAHFPAAGSHLERYASRFDAVEINSSFHRPHRPATYARWSAAVPASFRFAVKVPRTITHGLRLRQAGDLLETFLAEVSGLGDKLGCLLVQLPPSLDFEPAIVAAFFADLRSLSPVPLACEPRHPSWFAPGADDLLRELGVARVAADPARVPEAAEPGGWRDLSYYRLHGSPKMYYSAYSEEYLDALAARLRADAAAARNVWCIFDNTTLGAATRNALDLRSRLGDG